VRAVAAESFERIHRSNLVGMGVLPLEFKDASPGRLALTGAETFDVAGLGEDLRTRAELSLRIHRPGGAVDDVPVVCRIDTDEELVYYRHGGILPYVYRELVGNI
jgi:aconitate hydratase